MRKLKFGFLTRSDTNRPIQLQKKARKRLEAWNFKFKKKRNCTIKVAKTKALISSAVTAQLICMFVFAYGDCWFSFAHLHFKILVNGISAY